MPGGLLSIRGWSWAVNLLLVSGLLLMTPGVADATNETDTPAATPTPTNETATYNQTASDIQLNQTGNSTYRIAIGNGSARMVVLLDLSLFTHPIQGGTLAFASIGRLSGTPIINVRLGLNYAGITNIGSFLSNPLDGFSITGHTKLRFPFFEDATTENEKT
ncbi:MAG: hypothetical protein ABEJ48_05045 [Halobacteriales archaeon]